MLKEKLQKALNDQIQTEFQSAYLYLSMAAYFEHENLPGFAGWMIGQFKEEQDHARRLFEYVTARGGRVTLGAIDAPPATYANPLAVFEKVLEHEQQVSASIHSLYELAVDEKDYPTQVHLHWFIAEQVEEEKTAVEVLDQLKAIANHPQLLPGMDRRMAQRRGGES